MTSRLRAIVPAILVSLVMACSAAAPPTPTIAPTAPPVAAKVVDAPTNVSGPIDRLDGRDLMVMTVDGAKRVQVPESARLEQEGRGATTDLQPGLSVDVTGKPDGMALSIRIFPAALGTLRPGQFPMTGANQGNMMTNSVIESFDGKMLVVMGGANRFTITVPSDVEVLKPVPAKMEDLQVGKRILAVGTPGANGLFIAASVNILGTPPQVAR